MRPARNALNLFISLALCALAAWAGLATFVWLRIERHVGPAAPQVEFSEGQLSAANRPLTFEHDRELGFRPVPRVHYIKRDPHGTATEVATDSRGFRVDRPGLPEPDRVDVLVVGCSQSWGHAIANRDTYASILGRQFGLTVANASVLGYGMLQSLKMAERHRDLAPRILLYGFFNDHLFRNFEQLPTTPSRPAIRKEGANWVELPPAGHWRHPVANLVADGLIATYARFGWPREVLRGPVEEQAIGLFRAAHVKLGFPLPEATPQARPTMDEMPIMIEGAKLLLGRMQALAHAMGSQLVVVWIPQTDSPFMPMPPELIESLRSGGAIAIDAHPKFVGYYATPRVRELVIPNDGHMNERGHARIAEAVAEALVEPPLSLRHR